MATTWITLCERINRDLSRASLLLDHGKNRPHAMTPEWAAWREANRAYFGPLRKAATKR
jgi:hypothetical protein